MARKSQLIVLSTLSVGVGVSGSTLMVAKVTLADADGRVLYSTLVTPTMPIVDYRTATTGISPQDFKNTKSEIFETVQKTIASLIRNKVLVGHSLWLDLSVLGIPHPAKDTRDVSLYLPFRGPLKTSAPVVGLQSLVWQFRRRKIQDGRIDTHENVLAILELYLSSCDKWEEEVAANNWPCALPPPTFARCYL